MSYLLIFPNPFELEEWSPQMNLRTTGFLYLGVFLVYMALSYRPALVIWSGVAAVMSWSAGYFWVAGLSDTRYFTSKDVVDAGLSIEQVWERVLHPKAVGQARIANQIVFLVVVTIILTVTVWRSRRLVERQLAAENHRSALSRYFSPNIVSDLMDKEQPFDSPKQQPIAVLFADMVGFTALSESLEPSELVSLLREFHGRLARTAQRHGGTVDKFLGDAIMVHFGTPEPKQDDAVRAVDCAYEMISQISEWNQARRAIGQNEIKIGIGLHYGDAIAGNIGDENRLEYTVLGDTVNVASRLEACTRKLHTTLIISDSTLQKLPDDRRKKLDPPLKRGKPQVLKGRHKPVDIWYLKS
ncbi:MAG: adenylate/guanylate cyclase domain-containing protein [Pseudomonadota bacterium]